MNKYFKISLVSAALYVVFGVLLSLYDLGGGRFGLSIFGKISSCWSSGEIISTCFYGIKALDNAAFGIPYYGMILAAFISAITGLIAAYHALKTHERWWHVITIYTAANILIVFGSAFV